MSLDCEHVNIDKIGVGPGNESKQTYSRAQARATSNCELSYAAVYALSFDW